MNRPPPLASVAAPPHPGRVRVWIMAARLPTLPAAVVPVLVGTAAAHVEGHVRVGPFIAALAAALLIQIGANLANDYFDFRKGADTAERQGPARVTQSAYVTPRQVWRATVFVFALATLVGLYLAMVGGWPIVLIGLLSIAAALAYTGGPWPLGYHGLGDLFTFVFFGLVAVAGTTYLHTGTLSGAALVDALPVGFLTTAILVVNNLRDIATDRVAGKMTLAVRMGRRATQLYYLLLLAGSYAVPVARWLTGAAPWSLLPWLSLPLAVRLVRAVVTREGRALNPILKGTAQLDLVFGVLFAAGLVL